jgi:hypothetical protein
MHEILSTVMAALREFGKRFLAIFPGMADIRMCV